MVEQFVAQRTPGHLQKLYYKNSENRMVEQFVAQRTPDHLQKLYYKHSERKGPFTSRQERATKISYKYAPRENNQRIRVVEATARQRGGPPASGRPRGPGLTPTHTTGGAARPLDTKIERKGTKGRQEDGVTLLGQRSFGRENKLPPVSAPKGSDGSPRNASERPR